MFKLAIIIGSTRPERVGEAVAKWVHELAQKRSDAEFELVHIKDFNLPLLDEPVPPSQGEYSKEHTKKWAAKIASFDGYVFVTPEYNHGICGALKNAIDFLFAEWNNKAAGFKPREFHEKSVGQAFDQVIAWDGAMKTLRGTSRA
jgi:NAD(P)H-dependent FMN reductase